MSKSIVITECFSVILFVCYPIRHPYLWYVVNSSRDGQHGAIFTTSTIHYCVRNIHELLIVCVPPGHAADQHLTCAIPQMNGLLLIKSVELWWLNGSIHCFALSDYLWSRVHQTRFLSHTLLSHRT